MTEEENADEVKTEKEMEVFITFRSSELDTKELGKINNLLLTLLKTFGLRVTEIESVMTATTNPEKLLTVLKTSLKTNFSK